MTKQLRRKIFDTTLTLFLLAGIGFASLAGGGMLVYAIGSLAGIFG
jgi:hypothetical protein